MKHTSQLLVITFFANGSWSHMCCVRKSFPKQHTAINISSEMLENTASFDIKVEQVVAIVHDQGAN